MSDRGIGVDVAVVCIQLEVRVRSRSQRNGVRIGVLAAVAALTAACGGGDTPGVGGRTDITVSVVPLSTNAPLYYAIESGIFERNGLNVTIEPAASPIPVVASLVAGQADFGFVTTPVLINANREGTAVKCVSPHDGQVSPDRDASALVASPDSGITSLADLGGKSVAVVQLASINLVAAKKLIEDAGGTGTEFVAVPFPQMPQALADGRVDAAVIASPFVEAAIDAGAVTLAAPSSELFPEGTIYCYAATAAALEEDPETARAFQASVNEAITFAGASEENELAVKETLVEYLDLSPEQAAAQVIPSNYVPEINLDSIGAIQDLMLEQGLITDTVEPADLVWEPAS